MKQGYPYCRSEINITAGTFLVSAVFAVSGSFLSKEGIGRQRGSVTVLNRPHGFLFRAYPLPRQINVLTYPLIYDIIIKTSK